MNFNFPSPCGKYELTEELLNLIADEDDTVIEPEEVFGTTLRDSVYTSRQLQTHNVRKHVIEEEKNGFFSDLKIFDDDFIPSDENVMEDITGNENTSTDYELEDCGTYTISRLLSEMEYNWETIKNNRQEHHYNIHLINKVFYNYNDTHVVYLKPDKHILLTNKNIEDSLALAAILKDKEKYTEIWLLVNRNTLKANSVFWGGYYSMSFLTAFNEIVDEICPYNNNDRDLVFAEMSYFYKTISNQELEKYPELEQKTPPGDLDSLKYDLLNNLSQEEYKKRIGQLLRTFQKNKTKIYNLDKENIAEDSEKNNIPNEYQNLIDKIKIYNNY